MEDDAAKIYFDTNSSKMYVSTKGIRRQTNCLCLELPEVYEEIIKVHTGNYLEYGQKDI